MTFNTRHLSIALLMALMLPLWGCPSATVKPTDAKKKVVKQEALDLNNPTPEQLSKVPCANPLWVKPPDGMQGAKKGE